MLCAPMMMLTIIIVINYIKYNIKTFQIVHYVQIQKVIHMQ
jgi:hypothetical protein